MENKYKEYINTNNYQRIAGLAFISLTLIYLYWLFFHLNTKVYWIAYPFFAVQTFNFFLVTLSIVNHWKGNYRTQRPQLAKNPQEVAVVVPTYKEPVEILKRTIKSLLHIAYPGRVVILVSNDDDSEDQKKALTLLMGEMSDYWEKILATKCGFKRSLFLRHSPLHGQAKAGNLNQAIEFLRKYFPNIDLLLTQDADEIVYPDILQATVGYFSNPKVAYVQTIKQSAVSKEDPFGNHDLMWYGRTAAARDATNSMFACGSGVIWRISALEAIGGFSTWNLVEDLTTSYNLLSGGWESRYHYEALSKGLAPEDLANLMKQREIWAIDAMRIFFWDNPLIKRGLTFFQRLQFLETPLFYLNGLSNLLLVVVTSLCLLFSLWPTTADALTHAKYLIPSFLSMEAYLVLLADKIPFRRIRQYWVGFSPMFAIASLKALFYGPNKKPKYIVTRKENLYSNYLALVWPQILVIGLVLLGLIKTLIATPLYSEFDWAAVFWGFFQASFFFQIIKVSLWSYVPTFDLVKIGKPIASFFKEKLRNHTNQSLVVRFVK